MWLSGPCRKRRILDLLVESFISGSGVAECSISKLEPGGNRWKGKTQMNEERVLLGGLICMSL